MFYASDLLPYCVILSAGRRAMGRCAGVGTLLLLQTGVGRHSVHLKGLFGGCTKGTTLERVGCAYGVAASELGVCVRSLTSAQRFIHSDGSIKTKYENFSHNPFARQLSPTHMSVFSSGQRSIRC